MQDRIIKVDGQETWFLRHWVSDNGIVIEVSGPESLLLHEHDITEYDGSPLRLRETTIPEELQERFDEFWQDYLQAVAFTSMVDDENGGTALFGCQGEFDNTYPDAASEYMPLLTQKEQDEMRSDAEGFFMDNHGMFGDEVARAGRDFHYTRNGHGCGFWDGDWDKTVARILTDAAHVYGELELTGTRDDDGELTAAYIHH